MNFKEGGVAAMEVAASFAEALKEPLLLVHALDSVARQNLPEDINESFRRFALEQLEEAANHFRTSGVPTLTALHSGEPATSLVTEAVAHHARLLILGAPQGSAASQKMPIQVAREAPVTTLVVRQSAPLRKWLSDDRELRVLAGIDFSSASWGALRWVKWLRQLGTCDVTIAVLEPEVRPPAGAAAHCIAGADDMARKSTRAQENFFRQLVDGILGRPRLRVRFEYGFTRSDAHFIDLAKAVRADLVVFGIEAQPAEGGDDHPVWPGVLRYGPFNIALVPHESASVTSPLSPALPVEKPFC